MIALKGDAKIAQGDALGYLRAPLRGVIFGMTCDKSNC